MITQTLLVNNLEQEDSQEEDKDERYHLNNSRSQGIKIQQDRSLLEGQGDDNYHEAIQKAMSVRIKRLQTMMRSKLDMYQVLHSMRKLSFISIIAFALVGLFLPSYQHWSINFMRDIMSGDKKVGPRFLICLQVLHVHEVKPLAVPQYESLSVSKSFYKVLEFYPDLEDYFPIYNNSYIPPRSFFWQVFGTLHFDDAKRFIDEERQMRYQAEEIIKEKTIKVHPEVLKALEAVNYFSKKKGRALFKLN